MRLKKHCRQGWVINVNCSGRKAKLKKLKGLLITAITDGLLSGFCQLLKALAVTLVLVLGSGHTTEARQQCDCHCAARSMALEPQNKAMCKMNYCKTRR